jgi:DNA-binding NarL/FixJ family response regulator
VVGVTGRVLRGRLAEDGDVGGLAVAVCCEQPVVRTRVVKALQDAGRSPASVSGSVHELLDGCLGARPAAVVLGCELTPLAPPSAMLLVRAELPQTAIVVVCREASKTAIRKALRAGVDGLVSDADIETTLGVTIDAALTGQLCAPEAIRNQLARPAFSHREKQVLHLLAQGFTNGEIANRLYLSESTVKSHLASSFRKLRVSTRAEAAELVRDPEWSVALASRGMLQPRPLVDVV